MTREQESDSTLSPEKEERGVEDHLSHKSWMEKHGYQCPLHGGYLSQPVIAPERSDVFFFVGVIPMIIETVQQCINISESKLMR